MRAIRAAAMAGLVLIMAAGLLLWYWTTGGPF